MKPRILPILLVLAALTWAEAQTQLPRNVFGNGGIETTSSTNYGLRSTLGQTAIGVSSAAAKVSSAGFWFGLSSSTLVVTAPDLTTIYDAIIAVPIGVTSTTGQGILSAEVFLRYDGDLLTPTGVSTTGTLPDANWSIETNIEDGGQIDTYKIAMATGNAPLSGAGILIKVQFQVADVRLPASSILQFNNVLFNDGDPTNISVDGSLTIIGTTGTISSLPGSIIPREVLTITIVDADADLDGTAGTDQLAVTVENTSNGDTVNLTLAEDGAIAGTFSSSISTEFGTTAIVDALIQAQADDTIVSTYSDALDATGNGPTNRTAQTAVLGGADGSVAITLVSQPGDPLYIQITDADLNTNPSSVETVSVTVENSRTAESFSVVLTEANIDDDLFFGSLATLPGASTATEMNTAEDDVVTTTYDDVVTAVGDQQNRTTTNDVINPWGDADDNESLQAFDAAKALLHVLNPSATPIDTLATNVDIDPVNTGITPFDASLILQKRVGLIASFPVQDPTSTNHPQGTPISPKFINDQRRLSLTWGEDYLSVMIDERAGLLAGDLLLQSASGRVEMAAELSSYLSASLQTEQGLRIVFAGAEGVGGAGELLRIYGVGPYRAQLVRAEFNDGAITGVATEMLSTQATPSTFTLHPNTPNPFNPETQIRFDLKQASLVRLEIFDALGQRIRVLAKGRWPTGNHQVLWDGRNAQGTQVGNGVYIYRLQANESSQMRRMLLLK